MKKALIVIGSLIVLAAIALPLLRKYTKTHSPEAVATFDRNGLKMKVTYCQPSKKGREIFGGLVPYSKVWRTGANEATEITFSQDVKWGDQPVKAGTYTLFTVPEAGEWKAILNSTTGQWGAYRYDAAKNVAETTVKVIPQPNVIEKLTLSFAASGADAELCIVWDKTMVCVPIRK